MRGPLEPCPKVLGEQVHPFFAEGIFWQCALVFSIYPATTPKSRVKYFSAMPAQ